MRPAPSRHPTGPIAFETRVVLLVVGLLCCGCDRDAPTPAAAAPAAPAAPAPLPAELPDPESIEDLHAHSLAVIARVRSLLPNTAQPIFDEGHVHRRFGFDDRAIASFREGLQLEPRRPDIYQQIGFLLSQKNEMDAAEDAYRTALALDPRIAGAHTRLGLIHVHRGKTADALAAYQREIDAGSAGPETYYLQGQAFMLEKAHEKALAAFKRSLELDEPNENTHYGVFQACRALGRDEEAAAALARSREIKAATREAEDSVLAQKSNRGKQLEATAETYVSAAQAYTALERTADARWSLEAAARFVPRDPGPRYALAEMLRQTRDLDGAIEHARKALAVAPEHLPSKRLLAGLYSETGMARESGLLLRELVAAQPHDASLHCEYARAILRARLFGESSVTEGLRHASEAVRLERSARHLDVLAWAQFESGDRGAAITSLQEAVALAPDDEAIRARLEKAQRAAGGSR